MKKVDLLSINVTTGSYADFIDKIMLSAEAEEGHYTCVANVHTLVEAYKDHRFAGIIRNAGVVTPDGKPLTWALRLLHGIKQERIAGMDLLPDLLTEACIKRMPVYFYGGSNQLLETTRKFLAAAFPDLVIAGYYSPPFRVLNKQEEEQVLMTINESGAKLVFVVLGCPKQEKWMASMQGRLTAASIGIGGALAVLIGLQQRAPVWMQQSGLEWIFRLSQEPFRLFKRYAITNPVFIYLLLKEYICTRAGRSPLTK